MSSADSLQQEAVAWIEQDPDPETRDELTDLVRRAKTDEDARAELTDRFAGQLKFGTAGLRAELGAGPNRMNRVVVAHTSLGFASFLLGRAGQQGREPQPSVVIGFDARKNSDVFARDAAQIFQAAGVRAVLLPGPVPTPVTAFAVRHYGVSAGVMVTASHNPPRDNGYKVYLGDADAGSQIIPPVDAEIAEAIADAASIPYAEIARSQAFAQADQTVVAAYIAQTAAQVRSTTGNSAETKNDLRIAYTAMHGVGSQIAQQVYAAAGLPDVTVVPEQDVPDGDFPTVTFPNPEEPGALDLAFRTATGIDAELVIAHDPDADRLAVALPGEAGYTALTGNQLGLVLGWRMAERAQSEGKTGALACTIVSSPAVGEVAKHFGFDYRETLSGFKWVSRVPGLIFGFEEALGYLVHPDVVHDKDGISASAEIIALSCELKHEGKTLWDLLDEISATCGSFASGQVTVRLESRQLVEELSERLRQHPPAQLGGVRVTTVTDLREPGNAEVPANVLRFDLEDGSRLMIRPSGTEPKLKLYLDSHASSGGGATEQKAAAEAALERLTHATHAYLSEHGV